VGIGTGACRGDVVLDSVYKLSSIDQAAAIEMLLSHQQLTVQDRETIGAALALFRIKPSLGISDCLMLEIARKAGHLPLGTFDRNLGKIDGAQKL
jgi:predicted nucleic acid-binding protein